MRLSGMVLIAVLLGGCGANARESLEVPAAPVPETALAQVGTDDVQVFTNGTAATSALVAAVSGARRTVDAEIYEFDRPELVNAMLSATRRGVAVRLLGDPTVAVTVATLRRLSAAGAVATFFPVGPRQIDHVKLLAVDGNEAFFGGVNWGARSYRNQDYEVRLVGPAVSRLEHIFAADLRRAGLPARGLPTQPATAGEPQVMTTFPDDEIGRAVVSMVRAARRRLHIEMFVLTDTEVMAALVDAARRRVDVRILLDPSQDLNQAAAARLRAAGARCRFYRSQGEKLHAKAAVMDGDHLLFGSANWTASGLHHNHELDIQLVQPELAAAVNARMDADWRAAV
ncbi:MAG: phosphatidylserine/phosphatidylglycerophosphate/cardiolipin synthase family protein [Candidatus Dormibacteria bacterium]